MALDISTLTNPFVDELSFGLAKKVILGLDSLKNVRVETGVNGSLQLNTVDSTIYFTTSTCSTTDTGSTTFAGNVLSTCFLALNQDICLEDLQRVYYGKFMSQSVMGATDLGTFQDFIMSEKAGKVGQELERVIWRGNTNTPAYASVTGNLTLCNGWLAQAYAASATTTNVTRTAITQNVAVMVVDAAYSAAPAAIKTAPDLSIFLSPTDFDAYLLDMRNRNYFNFTGYDFRGITEIPHFGARNLMVKIANGLEGAASGTYILTYKDNIVFGTLAEKDFMSFDGIWNPFAKKYQVNVAFNAGTKFVFNEHVVRSHN